MIGVGLVGLRGMQMVWVCDNCNFTFSRVSEPDRCPDCGKQYNIREATEQEVAEFERNVALSKTEKW